MYDFSNVLTDEIETHSPTRSSQKSSSLEDGSFLSVEYAQTDMTRRTSLVSESPSFSSSSPVEWCSSKSGLSTSPTTPMTSTPDFYYGSSRSDETSSCFINPLMSGNSEEYLANSMLWDEEQDPKHHSQSTMISTIQPMTPQMLSSRLQQWTGQYSAYNSNAGTGDLSLSRPIFSGDLASQSHPAVLAEGAPMGWPTQLPSPPQTIAPSAAFQPLPTSSPFIKSEPSTPIKRESFLADEFSSSPIDLISTSFPSTSMKRESYSSCFFPSSPIELASTPVVPSQHRVEFVEYEDPDYMILQADFMTPRGQSDRLFRRGYERRRRVGPSSRPKPVLSRSGINCDAIIPQNEYACSYPDCKDKQTGHQRRFKRQEHKKRHEKTVHVKKEIYECYWCKRYGATPKSFTRTDNLKMHQRNTHGRKTANGRGNIYVASQDQTSQYFDPEWQGDLNSHGFPRHLCPEESSE